VDRDDKLVKAMEDLDEEVVISSVQSMLGAGVEPLLVRKGFYAHGVNDSGTG